jgi:hypothetical protein
MRISFGLLYILVASLLGYAALYMMMGTVNGGRFSWLGPVVLAASILLFVQGVSAFLPRLTAIWLILAAVALPIAVCALFNDWPLRCWIFAGLLGLTEGILLWIGRISNRGHLPAFVASIVIAVAWFIASVRLAAYFFSSENLKLSVLIVSTFLASWVVVIGIVICSSLNVFQRFRPDNESAHYN